jgi:hypothetical protein
MRVIEIFRQLTFTCRAAAQQGCAGEGLSDKHWSIKFSHALLRTCNKTLPQKKAAREAALSLLSLDGSHFHGVTVKLVALTPVPLGVVTAIFPVTAPVGTFAVS